MIIYKSGSYLSKEQLVNLFTAVEWNSADYPQKLHTAVTASETVFSAWDNAQLIGIMTAVSDTEMNVFFPYLIVHPDYQNKSIGKNLVSLMLNVYKNTYRKILICNKDKSEFYLKCGFSLKNEECPMMIIS